MKRTFTKKSGFGFLRLPLLVILLFLASCNTQNKPASADTATVDSGIIQHENEVTDQHHIRYCSNLVKEILISSPRYKKLTDGLLQAVKKNGGTSVDIIMDRSPEAVNKQASDYSAQYEMQITESYPDRRVNIAHFTFDPSKNTLYEYDVVRDRLITIDFDKNLLEHSGEYCK